MAELCRVEVLRKSGEWDTVRMQDVRPGDRMRLDDIPDGEFVVRGEPFQQEDGVWSVDAERVTAEV